MAQPGQITLYSNFYSPFGHRVLIALEEAGAQYTTYAIHYPNTPSWFVDINPVKKVPAITYGGPPSPPEAPHPEAARIAESLVIVEFLAELFPASGLHPSDLVQRARARHTITVFETQVFDAYIKFVYGQQPGAPLLDALAAFQARLPEAGGFAVGEWSIADVAAAPFMIRMPLSFEHDLGQYPEGEGKKVMEELRTPRFARLMRYIEDLKNYPSVAKTYDEEGTVKRWKQNPAFKRA
ncbi:thioredoxin-like protein [Earliella scabrosa]|nr:thioredoxin-like protein [Earliella scabrosa]